MIPLSLIVFILIRNYRSELFAFNQRLHEKFTEPNLRLAFTHESYIQKEQEKRKELGVQDVDLNLEPNDDLANLGDKILSTFTKAYLRFFLPKLPEEGIE